MRIEQANRPAPPTPARTGTTDVPGRGSLLTLSAHLVGCFFVWTSGIHVGIVAAGTDFYEPFAERPLFGWVAVGWREVFMAAPVVWGLAVAAGELAIGLCLLSPARTPRLAGWGAAIAFQVCLMLFGWGFWAWSVPALLLLVPSARADTRSVALSHGTKEVVR